MRQYDYDNSYDPDYEDYYEADYQDVGGTNSLVSYPSSVQNQLAQFQGFMRQGRMEAALAALQSQAGAELARANPEMYALLGALGMGHRGIMFQEMELDQTIVETEHRLFGVRVGSSVTTTTRMRQRRRGHGAY